MLYRSTLTLLAAVFAASSLRAEPVSILTLHSALAEERLAGITFALVDGPNVKTGAAGRFNVQSGKRMQAHHRVHIGSVAKTLIAIGLMRLASIGAIDLDAPISDLLPEITIDNRWERTHPVRVRHLLDHTAGLEDLRVWQMFSGRTKPDDPLASAFEKSRVALRARTRPGQLFSYSNNGYGLAGLVIERVTGQRYEAWLDAHLLRPLGMRNSTFRFVTQRDDQRLAWGHNDDLSLAPALPVALRPAAQFTTTAADMGIFARFLMSDGTVGGQPFIRPELLAAMGVPVESAAARAGLRLGYRFGLASRDRGGHVGRCHSGNIIGYRAMLCVYPEEKKAFFYSINTDGESANYDRFERLLRNGLELAKRQPVPAMKAGAFLGPWSGYYVPAVSGIELERYSSLLSDGFSLEAREGGARLVMSGTARRDLDFVAPNLLRRDDRIAPSHALLRGEKGGYLLTDGLRTYVRTSVALGWLLWIGLAFGVAGFLYLTFVTPLLGWRQRRSRVQPFIAAPVLLILGGWAMWFQPFERLGDLTLGSLLLCAGSVLLLVGAFAQGFIAWFHRYRWWQGDAAAAVLVLQWCAALAWFGLIPLILWM